VFYLQFGEKFLEKLVSTKVGVKDKQLKVLKVMEHNQRLNQTIRLVCPEFTSSLRFERPSVQTSINQQINIKNVNVSIYSDAMADRHHQHFRPDPEVDELRSALQKRQ